MGTPRTFAAATSVFELPGLFNTLYLYSFTPYSGLWSILWQLYHMHYILWIFLYSLVDPEAFGNCYRSIILVIPKMFLYGCDIFNGNGAIEVDTMRSWREWVFLD